MQFGLFYFSNYELDHDYKYESLLETVQYADKHEFSSVWLPERHFHDFGGNFPNPSILGAALATVTEHISIRSGSVVLPLHDTIRVAEEWSVVDNLSNGRVELSFASGWHINDFVLKPENYDNRHKIMYKQIDEFKKLWSGEKTTRVNSHGKEIELNIYPQPIQKKVPIWITAGSNEETFRSAGKIGANVLTMLLKQNTVKLEHNIKVYKEALRQNGHDVKGARIAVMLHTYIGKDIQEVKKVVEKPFKNYLYSNLSLFENLMKSKTGTTNIPIEEIKKNHLDDLLHFAFEKYWNKAALFGTQESCKKLLKTLYDIGVTEIACLVDFGLSKQKIVEGLDDLNELRKDLSVSQKNSTVPVNLSTQNKINRREFVATPISETIEKNYSEEVNLSSALDTMIDFMGERCLD